MKPIHRYSFTQNRFHGLRYNRDHPSTLGVKKIVKITFLIVDQLWAIIYGQHIPNLKRKCLKCFLTVHSNKYYIYQRRRSFYTRRTHQSYLMLWPLITFFYHPRFFFKLRKTMKKIFDSENLTSTRTTIKTTRTLTTLCTY